MSLLIKVQHRSAYGVTRIYPANDVARKLVILLGLKTFRELDMQKLVELGYEIEWLPAGESEAEGRGAENLPGEQTNETKEKV